MVGRATGAHYSASSNVNVPIGVDGVGYINGTKDLVYFTTFAPGRGAYSEYINAKKDDIFPFPKGYASKDAISRVAALSNGVMSNYLSLYKRVPDVKKNATIAILGVTGVGGKLAIQLAKNVFGAKKVIGLARSQAKLEKLKESEPLLDAVISFEESDEEILKNKLLEDVDVVLDYIWGKAATKFLGLITKSKSVSSNKQYWIQIGLIGGESAEIPASLLRSSNIEILGSGIGPYSQEDMKDVLRRSTEELAKGSLSVETRQVPIEEISDIWSQPWVNNARIYFTF